MSRDLWPGKSLSWGCDVQFPNRGGLLGTSANTSVSHVWKLLREWGFGTPTPRLATGTLRGDGYQPDSGDHCAMPTCTRPSRCAPGTERLGSAVVHCQRETGIRPSRDRIQSMVDTTSKPPPWTPAVQSASDPDVQAQSVWQPNGLFGWQLWPIHCALCLSFCLHTFPFFTPAPGMATSSGTCSRSVASTALSALYQPPAPSPRNAEGLSIQVPPDPRGWSGGYPGPQRQGETEAGEAVLQKSSGEGLELGKELVRWARSGQRHVGGIEGGLEAQSMWGLCRGWTPARPPQTL